MPRRRRRRWPFPPKITGSRLSSRPKTPDAVRKLLEPNEDIEFEATSSCSELSDAFEEFHRESFLNSRKTGKKSITKYEANLLTMAEFTDDFKSVMGKVKDELQINQNMMAESIETIEEVISAPKEKQELPEELKKEINELLSDPEQIIKPIEAAPTPAKSSEFSYDYMSGIWNVLEAHCANTEFTVSPMNYDSFNQQQPHWLEKPAVSQQVIDDSKLKCQKWLSEQHK